MLESQYVGELGLCDCKRYKEVKGAILDGVEGFPSYPDYEVGQFSNGGPTYDLDVEVHNLSVPPSLIGRSYKNMVAYGNHFKAIAWLVIGNMVTYDFGVSA